MVDQAGIHRKVVSSKNRERRDAVWQLRINFAILPDKEQAWKDLHRLTTHDEHSGVRWEAAYGFGTAFPHIPDKEQAWKDLHRLTHDEDDFVRWGAADAFGTAFPHIPDKEQAWKDLHRLTHDEDDSVRSGATDALGAAFPHIPDKEQAWDDLHRLSQDEDDFVRRNAADALGSAFPYIPDKGQAWDDLHRLTQDELSDVRASANHFLGRASIFKATNAEREEDFRKELKNALEFFENSSKEDSWTNPSKFCLPFYRSFYTITFEKAGAEVEVQKYLAEAKDAAEGSKSKEQLLEAIENLANALTEAKSLREANLDRIKRNFNAYRRYCDRAGDLIGAAEEKTPGAARILRRGLPIIDERIKETTSEIQEKARAVCKLTQSTALEDLGVELNQQRDNLSKIRDPIGLEKSFESLQFILSEMCARLPEDKRGFACETLEKAKNEPFVEDRINLMNIVLGSMQSSIGEIKTSIKIGKIEKSTGVQIGGERNIQQIDVMSGAPASEHDKYKFTLREIAYGAIIDIAIHALVIISIDHYLESSMDKIAPYLTITFVMVLAITIFALRKLPNAKSS